MKVGNEKVVAMDYVLKDKATGKVIDKSSDYGQPFSFLFGAHNIIPGLETQMEGSEIGDKKVIEVSAENAYGKYDESLVQKVPIQYFKGMELKKGMVLEGKSQDGHTINMVVIAFDENEVTVDLNHPLAGRDLVFEIEIKDIRDATEEELKEGKVHIEK